MKDECFYRFPKLYTKKDGRVKFHPKSINSEETFFTNKFMIYYQKMKSSSIFIHDATMIPPLPLLFFGGKISVEKDDTQETIAVDDWIVFQAPEKIARLVKVSVSECMVHIYKAEEVKIELLFLLNVILYKYMYLSLFCVYTQI